MSEEEKFTCSLCSREFNSKESLDMHNSAKHSEKIREKELVKPSTGKIRNWLVFAVILGIASYGIFWAFGNITGNTVSEGDLGFKIPTKAIHWHPTLTIKINGEVVEIPENIGITSSVHFPVHTHEDAVSGVLHMEIDRPSRDNVVLGYFFEVWGKEFSNKCIFEYCTDKGELKMYVNDKENFEFGDYFMRDKDKILIEYNSFNE